jgi:hypothetical protein
MELEDFKGKSWREAKSMVKKDFMLLVFSEDKKLRESSKIVKDHGEEAGLCYIAASLLSKDYDSWKLIATSVFYLKGLLDHEKCPKGFSEKIHNLESWSYYTLHGKDPVLLKKWPLKVPNRIMKNSYGTINFLLLEALKGLDTNVVSHALMANSIVDFFEWNGKRVS